ncbi:hypothetical protein JHK85_024794 [Glycine max]|nr:hypothetical protein JHK87_024187 [Glycine soja]KAG5006252.1 hypothetical protein JHK85_024794 [Glycine max]
MLRLKIKEELYGDEQKVKITVVKAEKVNYSSEKEEETSEDVNIVFATTISAVAALTRCP